MRGPLRGAGILKIVVITPPFVFFLTVQLKVYKVKTNDQAYCESEWGLVQLQQPFHSVID